MNLVVCANVEMLIEGTYMSYSGSGIDVDGVYDVVRDFCDESRIVYTYDSLFRNWNGGKYDQVYDRCGFVAYRKGATPDQQELAEKLNDVIRYEIEFQDNASQLDDCEYYAEALASGEVEVDDRLKHLLVELIPGVDSSDKNEIITALRQRAAGSK